MATAGSPNPVVALNRGHLGQGLPGCRLGFPVLASGLFAATSPRPRLPWSHLLPEPAGPTHLPPPIAPKPRRAIPARDPAPPPGLQRGHGSRETPPGRLELTPLPAQYSPGPGSPRPPRGLPGRETEAREGGELPEPQHWSVRAASNPEAPLGRSAGLRPSPPSGKLCPSLPLWSPSPCSAHFPGRAKPGMSLGTSLGWAPTQPARASQALLATHRATGVG